MAKEYTELQLKAKEAGIANWWVKLAKTLEEELANKSEKVTIVEVAEVFKEEVAEKVEEVIGEVVEEPIDAMELLRVLKGRNWDQAMCGIKCLANKSDLWEFRELIEEEYEKSLKEK